MSRVSRDQQAILRHHRPLWAALKGPYGKGIPSQPLAVTVPEAIPSFQLLFDQGYSLTDVGLMFGLSRERIRQIARAHGLRRWPIRSPARVWSSDRGCFVALRVTNTEARITERRKAHRVRRRQWWDNYQEAFWARAAVSGEHDCWVWQGARTNGYGSAPALPGEGWLGRPPLYAHRRALLFAQGFLTPGMHVCHHCDHPLCINPAHLYEGTAADNIHDAIAKGRHLASPERFTKGRCRECGERWDHEFQLRRYCSPFCRNRASYRRQKQAQKA